MLTEKIGVNLTLLCTVLSLPVLSACSAHFKGSNNHCALPSHNFRQKPNGNGTISPYFAV
ncbi:hypothetical protein [Oceanisphaera sp. W20_SRM_FM3]|uniref:hypothetical protein n=1 Tax=Oceanisphaera sp. W20_SRM_FM3 TaxID=3240267 RepID=UPI003F9692FA